MSLVLLLAAAAPAHGGARSPRVTIVADSVGGALAAPAARRKLGAGLDVDLEAVVCRTLATPGCHAPGAPAPPSALDTIERLGALGQVVVVDVGYNDPSTGYAASLDRVMAALVARGVRHVVWVTLAETQGVWVQTNAQIRAAGARWPQLAVADWARVVTPDLLADGLAHLNEQGAVALARFLRPVVTRACGDACAAFCGLLRTPNGFDPVSAYGVDCTEARAAVAGVERGAPGAWTCSRSTDGVVELDCVDGDAHARVLERAPVPVRRAGGVVVLANWSFRLHRGLLEAREARRGWLPLGRGPWCVPDVPREALVALRLRPTTRHAGCFREGR